MILNLVYPERGHIQFKHSKFPDGQQQITIERSTASIDDVVTIYSRLNNFMDLETIICATESLRGLGFNNIHLYTPYFMGARSDRKFSKGSNNYLRDVICPIINSLDFKSVEVLDPHSYVLEACIQRFKSKDNSDLVVYALNEIFTDTEKADYVLVSPDEGASKKIDGLIKEIGVRLPTVIASKHRDPRTGNFLGFKVPLEKEHLDKDLVWVDDICDGGGTFIGEAEEANKQGHVGKKYLIVTHGIFSQGFAELTKHFSHIYCTNSYSSVGDISGNGLEKTHCLQYNVF